MTTETAIQKPEYLEIEISVKGLSGLGKAEDIWTIRNLHSISHLQQLEGKVAPDYVRFIVRDDLERLARELGQALPL